MRGRGPRAGLAASLWHHALVALLLLGAGCVAAAALIADAGYPTGIASRAQESGAAKRVSGPQPGKINIHIICHSHFDAGRLKNLEQYYWGSAASVTPASAQYAIDSVVESLRRDALRKFTIGEVAFLSRWWDNRPESDHTLLSRLVAAGQLEVAGGGWVQHDEGLTHYGGIVDQMTLGHRFLKEELGFEPHTGWQLDPYGHSAASAALLRRSGLRSLFLGRTRYDVLQAMRDRKSLAFLWDLRGQGGQAVPGAQTLRTHASHSGGFAPPDGFDFDLMFGDAEPVIDDYLRLECNVAARVAAFKRHVAQLAQDQPSSFGEQHLAVLFGGPFYFAAAESAFANLDRLIDAVNNDGEYNAFYSTPTMLDASMSTFQLPAGRDDLSVYADAPQAVWTGLFASRPGHKGYFRYAGRFLQVVRQVEALGQVLAEDRMPEGGWTRSLDEAVAMTQHHDAMTGTVRQAVADDYAFRVHMGMEDGWQGMRQSVEVLLDMYGDGSANEGGVRGARGAVASRMTAQPGGQVLHHCPHLNVTLCRWSVIGTSRGQDVRVVAWNPLAWPRSHWLRLPVRVPDGSRLVVRDAAGAEVPSQVWALGKAEVYVRDAWLGATNDPSLAGPAGVAPAPTPGPVSDTVMWLHLTTPPVGYTVVTIKTEESAGDGEVGETGAGQSGRQVASEARKHSGGPATSREGKQGRVQDQATLQDCERVRGGAGDGGWVVRNEFFEVTTSASTGLVSSVENLEDGTSAAVTLDLAYYLEWAGADGKGQLGGHHVFRPAGRDPVAIGPVVTEAVCSASGIMELRQHFSDWAFLTVRLLPGERAVVVDWTIGAIPLDAGEVGRDVVLRITTDLGPRTSLATDANGRLMVERARPGADDSDPVASGFYPASAAGCLARESGPSGRAACVVVDRGLGVASARDGEMEIMVHRRLKSDDGRGLSEPLDEDMCGTVPGNAPQAPCQKQVVWGRARLLLSGEAGMEERLRTAMQLREEPWALVGVQGRYSHGVDSIKDASATHAHTTSNNKSGGGASADPPGPLGVSFLAPLPRNLHLLSLQWWRPGVLLVRLSHLYPEGTAGDLGQTTAVDLAQLFTSRMKVLAVQQVSLTANQPEPDPVPPAEASHLAAQGVIDPALLSRIYDPAEAPDLISGGGSEGLQARTVVLVRPLDIATVLVKVAAADEAGDGALAELA